MHREGLHPLLAADYTPERGYGVEKIDHEGFENIYFVIPKPLPMSKEDISDIPHASLVKSLRKAFSALNAQKSLDQMDSVDQLISTLISRQEALSSSRIEGTFSTIDEIFSTESDELLKTEVENKKTDALSILAYAKAMEIIMKKISLEKEKGVTLRLFEEIHRSIVSKDPSYKYIPGKLRAESEPGSVVQIGGVRRREDSVYNPAPPKRVHQLMKEFISWLSNEAIREEGDGGLGIPLPLRMALAHAHFEAIHPFSDGNGRVGRFIWAIQMILSGLTPIYISGFIEASKDGYYAGLKAYQQKLDILPLLDYISDGLVASKNEEDKTREALKILFEEWKTRGKFRQNSAAERLLPKLLGMPILGAEEVTKILSVTLATAIGGLEKLAETGILKETTGRQRRKKWAAHEVLTILKRPFGMLPSEALEIAAQRANI